MEAAYFVFPARTLNTFDFVGFWLPLLCWFCLPSGISSSPLPQFHLCQDQQSRRFCRPSWILCSPLPQFRLRDQQSHRFCHCTGLTWSIEREVHGDPISRATGRLLEIRYRSSLLSSSFSPPQLISVYVMAGFFLLSRSM